MFPRDILPEWITKCSLAADAKFGESAYGCECYLLTICFWVKKSLFISQNNFKTEQIPESCLDWQIRKIRLAKNLGLYYEFNNLFVTSKNETTNSPIHEFKVLHKAQRAFLKCLFNGALCLIFTLKKIKARLFHFNDILQQFKFVNWRICGFVFWCQEQVDTLVFVYDSFCRCL